MPGTRASFVRRLERRVLVMPSGCWEWQGQRDRDGYGKIAGPGGRAGMMWLAHRAAWFIFRGPIPGGLGVLHRCDNPPCVNPAHLFLGTQADNLQDCSRKGRTGPRKRAYNGQHWLQRKAGR